VLENDRALLDSFRRGEREALTQVFRHYLDDVARTLRAGVVVHVEGQRTRVGQRLPEHEVEALIQETFTKAFAPKARESYDGVRPYGAWLATIARNLLVDRARNERRDARVIPVDDLADLPAASTEHDPTWKLEEEQLGRLVGEVKATLEEPDLSIFKLRFEEQKSFRETAQALGVSEIVVRRRDTRLRAQILDLLRSRGFLENARVRIGTSLLPRKNRQMG
jgi:RNA polymerase sigma factor (sigma-70 family)